jgi:hypothetical protein
LGSIAAETQYGLLSRIADIFVHRPRALFSAQYNLRNIVLGPYIAGATNGERGFGFRDRLVRFDV